MWAASCASRSSFTDSERRFQYAGFSLGEALFFLASFVSGTAEPILWKSALGEVLFFLTSSGLPGTTEPILWKSALGEVLFFLTSSGVFTAGATGPMPWKPVWPHSQPSAQVAIGRRAWALALPAGRCTTLLLLRLRSFLLLQSLLLFSPPWCPTLFANSPNSTSILRTYGLLRAGLPCH